MNVIIEGPDGSGKTTLAHMLIQHVPWVCIPSSGPEKYPGEIIERAHRYLDIEGCILDRHPLISDPIYSRFRKNATRIPQDLINRLYQQRPLFIYCHGRAGPHKVKDHDTSEHLELVNSYEDAIRDAYEEWAAGRVQLRYRVGDGIYPIIQAVKEFCNG